jgi:hypothetical protein
MRQGARARVRLYPFYNVTWADTRCANVACNGLIEERTGRGIDGVPQQWHSECFCCAKCGSLISVDSSGWKLRNTQPICLSCRTEEAARCAICGTPVLCGGHKVSGLSFHTECFCCAKCGSLISVDSSGWELRNTQPICLSCRTEEAARCAICGKPVLRGYKVSGLSFHAECFACPACPGLRRFAKDESKHPRLGWPVCREHATGDLPPGAEERMLAGPPLRPPSGHCVAAASASAATAFSAASTRASGSGSAAASSSGSGSAASMSASGTGSGGGAASASGSGSAASASSSGSGGR